MVSFLHYWALRQFVGLAHHLGREEDAENYSRIAAGVKLSTIHIPSQPDGLLSRNP